MKKLAHKYIISICIPTFNRSKELIATLDSIVKQDVFDDSVEVVVVDNASTDATEILVKQFGKKHKNVFYYKNENNLGPDKNILRAAKLGRGKYIKLLNDNKSFLKGALRRMMAIFRDSNENVIFFKNSEDHLITKTSSVDEFLREVSFHSTWLGGISYRRNEMDKIDMKKIKEFPYFSQTELMFVLLYKKQASLVVSGEYFHEPHFPIRSGYNFFEAFGHTYVRLLLDLEKKNLITAATLKRVKKDLLLDHIFPFSFDFLFRPQKAKLNTENAIHHLYRNFKDEPWLYLFPVWILLKVFKAVIKRIGRLVKSIV